MITFIIILNFIFSLFYLINIKLIILKNIKNYNHIKEILEELCTICSKFFLFLIPNLNRLFYLFLRHKYHNIF